MKDKDINMILHAGDLSYADCDQQLWDSYGEMIEPLASYTPWMVCAGNHEIEFNGTDYSNLFTAFENRYRMPYVKQSTFGDVIIKLLFVFIPKTEYLVSPAKFNQLMYLLLSTVKLFFKLKDDILLINYQQIN
jgi:hypothetical protein